MGLIVDGMGQSYTSSTDDEINELKRQVIELQHIAGWLVTKQTVTEVKFKKLCDDAVIPTYAKEGDACVDLTAVSMEVENVLDDQDNVMYSLCVYKTGLSLEIPQGYVGLIFPRSSVSKTSMVLSNSVGVIDSGYRGEIMFKYRSLSEGYVYDIGDRIGQLMIVPIPMIEYKEVEVLSETQRGTGGFGSSGK